MPRDDLVYRTALGSLFVQLLVGGVTAAAYFVPVAPAVRDDLRPILTLELGSQVVEFLWYAAAVCAFRSLVAWARYLDWQLSTPTMLAATALFLQHRRGAPLADVPRAPLLYVSFGLNALMLSFGFAAEVEAMPRAVALPLGGAALVGSFAALGTFADRADALSVGLFFAMFGVWALYGVAAALPHTPKNVAYNGLDLVAKNFYGAFLLGYALWRRE